MSRNALHFIVYPTVFVAFCLCLAFGGCGGGGEGKRAGTAPGFVRIGEDAGRIGRLEEEATVKAVVFDAQDAVGRSSPVVLAPGTWLVPASAMRQPIPCCDETAEDAYAQ